MQFVQARNYRKGRSAKIRLLVVHDMELPETPTTAELCARVFATTTRDASAHYCVDNDSEVQCVRESDTAYAAPPCNSDGIHLEHAGNVRQTTQQWLDDYGVAMLQRSARLARDICQRNRIPMIRLTDAQLKAGASGIVGHDQVTRVYKISTHTDPGPNFPWGQYISWINTEETDVPTSAQIVNDDVIDLPDGVGDGGVKSVADLLISLVQFRDDTRDALARIELAITALVAPVPATPKPGTVHA